MCDPNDDTCYTKTMFNSGDPINWYSGNNGYLNGDAWC